VHEDDGRPRAFLLDPELRAVHVHVRYAAKI